MKTIFDSFKELITPDLIQKAADTFNETDSKISGSIPSISAGFLGLLLKKGHSQQINNLLDEAGKLDIFSSIKHLVEGTPSHHQQQLGDQFLEHLMGDRAADFTQSIVNQTGLSKVAANGWISILSSVFLGFLGNKMKIDNLKPSALFDLIKEEKDSFIDFIPSDLMKIFKLDTLFEATPTVKSSVYSDPDPVKKKSNWWMWLIPLLALFLGFYFWRSCGSCNQGCQSASQNEQVVAGAVNEVKETVETTITETVQRVSKELTLPDGIKLNAYEGGIEDRIIKFLESDEYKKSDNEVLKNKWFEFEDIDFEFESATKLISGQSQLDNIVAILKNYKDVKIEIAASTDKKGSDESNLKLSEERAKTIGEYMNKAGVGSQVINTVGFGEKFAEHSENESDAARAEDRDIALRFVK